MTPKPKNKWYHLTIAAEVLELGFCLVFVAAALVVGLYLGVYLGGS